MTPRERARHPLARVCPKGPVSHHRPRAVTEIMTAKSDSPAEGLESIDTEDLVHGTPLEGESDEFVALVLEGQKQEAITAADTLTRALLNDDQPLTDDDVARLAEIGNAFRAIYSELVHRVPEEHRVRYKDS